MSERRWTTGIALLCLLAVLLAVSGCNTVYVRGEAMTALENSAIQAEVAAALAEAGNPDLPPKVTGYLRENAVQWRAFMSSAKRYRWTPPATQPESG